MLVDEGTYRVHDYGFIRRRHGKQTINDKWTLKMYGLERALRWASSQIGGLKGKALEILTRILKKALDKI